MATDPPPPDLGAIRANLEVFLGQLVTWREMETGWIRALLAAYDAQAARLAAVEQARDLAEDGIGQTATYWREQYDLLASRCAAAERERDQQTALVRQWDERDHAKTVRIAELERERDRERDGWVRCTEMRLAAEQRAARLAALEEAARAYVQAEHKSYPLAIALAAAVEALGPPPGESS